MYALASLGAPPLLRGRRGTMCTAKGLDVRPGVPWGSAAFAWQAWDNLHCQGVGCTDYMHYIYIYTQCDKPKRDHKMCGCARKSAEHYFGQRKYGEHTIVLIVCRRKKNIRAWWSSMKAKQLTHKQLTLRTYIHRYLNPYLPTYLPTYLPPSSLHHSYASSSLLAFCSV